MFRGMFFWTEECSFGPRNVLLTYTVWFLVSNLLEIGHILHVYHMSGSLPTPQHTMNAQPRQMIPPHITLNPAAKPRELTVHPQLRPTNHVIQPRTQNQPVTHIKPNPSPLPQPPQQQPIVPPTPSPSVEPVRKREDPPPIVINDDAIIQYFKQHKEINPEDALKMFIRSRGNDPDAEEPCEASTDQDIIHIQRKDLQMIYIELLSSMRVRNDILEKINAIKSHNYPRIQKLCEERLNIENIAQVGCPFCGFKGKSNKSLALHLRKCKPPNQNNTVETVSDEH